MTIRKTGMGDIEALAAVERSAAELFRGTHFESAIGGETLHPDKHARAIADGTHWVEEQGDAIAGFCCAHAMQKSLYIDELAVGADFQGHGIGRRLMETAIAEARHGFSAVSLITDRTLPWNAPFYATLGFVEWDEPEAAILAELADEEADGFDMTRRIAMILRL